MKTRTATPSLLNRSVQASNAPMASDKAAKPGATTSLLKPGEKTGAKAFLEGSRDTATNRTVQPSSTSTPTALNKIAKPSAKPTLLKPGEKTSGATATKRTEEDSTAPAFDKAVSLMRQVLKSRNGPVVRGIVAVYKAAARAEQDEQKTDAKSISPRKLAANRQNAQLSTGPKTDKGKRWSRRNRLKHGILASDALMKWEFPRLCRGGTRSLTDPGVHPRNSWREPRSTRKGETGWTSMKA